MNIRQFKQTDSGKWDQFVTEHPEGTHCHLSGWKRVFEENYHHAAYYLLAEKDEKILGLLPLFYIKSRVFGRSLVSMPFLSYGGVLSLNQKTEEALIIEANKLQKELEAGAMELRYKGEKNNAVSLQSGCVNVENRKVTMLLDLPGSGDELFQSFKSKLRSQIRRPIKEGMQAKIGGAELIDDFYTVFGVNMRDLGSPVHSKTLFESIVKYFKESARVGVVYYENQPVASGIILSFRNTVEIPWASSLREFGRYAPNMLLYWTFLEFASDNGWKYFDFGRSTPDEGTYRFKKQWGALPVPLSWHVYGKEGDNGRKEQGSGVMNLAVTLWQKLPVPLANYLGPKIRKSISL